MVETNRNIPKCLQLIANTLVVYGYYIEDNGLLGGKTQRQFADTRLSSLQTHDFTIASGLAEP